MLSLACWPLCCWQGLDGGLGLVMCHIPKPLGRQDVSSPASILPPLPSPSPSPLLSPPTTEGLLSSNSNVGMEPKEESKPLRQSSGALSLGTKAWLPHSSLQPHPQEEEVAGPILQIKKLRLRKKLQPQEACFSLVVGCLEKLLSPSQASGVCGDVTCSG